MKSFVKAIENFGELLIKHSPEILTGLGIVGVISTTVMAVEITPKAIDVIEEEEEELNRKLTKKEIINNCWKLYVPTGLSGIATISCILLATKISLKRTASLATLYSVSEAWIDKYQKKVIENIGEKKEKALRDDINRDFIEQYPAKSSSIIQTGFGDYLILDAYSGQYFRSTIEKVKSVINDINFDLNKDGYVPLNDYYDKLGIRAIPSGDYMGWNREKGLIDFDFCSQIAEYENRQEPCFVISFKGHDPFKGFDKFA